MAHKAIVSYTVGKRDSLTSSNFIKDLRQRVINQPVIDSDTFWPYPEAVERYFRHGRPWFVRSIPRC